MKPDSGVKLNEIMFPEMDNGWSVWLEEQHYNSESHYFITISWNPFVSSAGTVKNVLVGDDSISERETVAYFGIVLQNFRDELNRNIKCQLLTYQELLDFLSFTLSMGTVHVEMPETPLYINDLISQDADIQFNTANNVIIQDNTVLTVSLPIKPNLSDVNEILSTIHDQTYRHVQRLLLFSKEKAHNELQRYTKSWCPGRNAIKELLLQNLIKKINGYYSGTLFILAEDYNACLDTISAKLNELRLPYRIEDYNLRDVFWGSLPGIFRANITPPIMGFNSFNELLFIE